MSNYNELDAVPFSLYELRLIAIYLTEMFSELRERQDNEEESKIEPLNKAEEMIIKDLHILIDRIYIMTNSKTYESQRLEGFNY